MNHYTQYDLERTICALATAPGKGAIALIRISGKSAIKWVNHLFYEKNLEQAAPNSLHIGTLRKKGTIIDQVVVSIFKAPKSYTGEDIVEISTHGSLFIQNQVLKLLIDIGCRQAQPGEFTFRAFINKKLDLSQAEAVADIINAQSQKAHELALKQLKGGVSNHIKKIKEELIKFAALIELELDFSLEDIEFANRTQLIHLLNTLEKELSILKDSFEQGNAIKQGISVAIVGPPNVGKSTLLNTLLKENKAIVSDIPGTTRDPIEALFFIQGYQFRFIDTAGIRPTSDAIEKLGINKTHHAIKQSQIVLYLLDASEINQKQVNEALNQLSEVEYPFFIINKIDALKNAIDFSKFFQNTKKNYLHPLSAKTGKGLPELKKHIIQLIESKIHTQQILISSIRHYQALDTALIALRRVKSGIKKQSFTDLIATDLRQALFALSDITGGVSYDNVLDSVFSNFCIGK